jgi:inorganic pyrophosphatase
MVKYPGHETSIGKNPPGNVNGIIEIPKGSRAKYEVDKESGLIADDNIIAVAEEDPSVSHMNDVKDLPEHLRAELKHLFENYKTLEN